MRRCISSGWWRVFSRYHKYTLGTELRNASREVVEQVIRANAARNRAPELLRLRDGLERVLVLLRLAKEAGIGVRSRYRGQIPS